MNTITLGVCPANPICVPDTAPAIIPTPLARFHARIASCSSVAELTDVAMQIAPNRPESLSIEAQRELFEFANRRFSELRGQEHAA